MLTWIEAHPGLASWVQAVGAITAIAIAIWLAYWQKAQALAQAKAAEREQVQHLLRNLLDEMIVVSENFGEENGKALLASPPGEVFPYTIPVMDNPFPIFDACVSKLGQIQNDELRRLIINGYGRANGFVSSIRHNNLMLERLEQATYLVSVRADAVHEERRDAIASVLADYATTLKSMYVDTMGKMEKTKAAINAELRLI